MDQITTLYSQPDFESVDKNKEKQLKMEHRKKKVYMLNGPNLQTKSFLSHLRFHKPNLFIPRKS